MTRRLVATALDTVVLALLALAIAFTVYDFSYLPGVDHPGWSGHGVEVDQVERTLPDGRPGTALRLRSVSDDGFVDFSFRVPPGRLNWSLFVRGDGRSKANLYLMADQWELAAARGGEVWKRFTLTQTHQGDNHVTVQVGGGKSFTIGEELEIWAPMVGRGIAPAAPRNVSEAEWILSQANSYVSGGRLWNVILVLGTIAFFRYRKVVRTVLARRTVQATLSYGLIAALSWIGLEGLSFATLALKHPVAQVMADAKVIWDGQISQPPANTDLSTTFSPLTQVRRIPGALLGPYDINRMGLVDNEPNDSSLAVMPEKPPNAMRVILYGGSTAMGIGAPDGSKTISAQLERLLNEHSKDGTRFQVLNFGHGGGQSYTDLMFMASTGSHLEADASIALTGFNDAFFATQSSGVFTGRPYVGNWSDFSYHYHDAINGLSSQRGIRLRFLPFSSLLANDISRGDGDAKAVAATYDAMPARLVTDLVDRQEGRDGWLKTNLRFAAGQFTTRPDQVYLCYLQPHPLQYRVLQEPQEKELTLSSIQRLVPLPLDEYSKRMGGMFDAYGQRVAELRQEYTAFSNIGFYDIRRLFEDFDQQAYVDIIHYSPAGQQRIAERMFEDLAKSPRFAAHINGR